MVGLYTGVFEFVPGGGMGLARYFIALLVYIRKSGAWRLAGARKTVTQETQRQMAAVVRD